MLRKEGIMKMALSCILAITLISCVVSIGYCGGGALQPGDKQEVGPPVIGTLVIIGGTDDDLINLGSEAEPLWRNFKDNKYFVPEARGEMAGTRFPNGQSKITFPGCQPNNGTGSDELVVKQTSKFKKFNNDVGKAKHVIVDVKLMWLVP